MTSTETNTDNITQSAKTTRSRTPKATESIPVHANTDRHSEAPEAAPDSVSTRIGDTNDREAWDSGLEHVKVLGNTILDFLASIVRQDFLPLSPGLTFKASDKPSRTSSFVALPADQSRKEALTRSNWFCARRELDRTFRSLVTWQRDLSNEDVEFAYDQVAVEDIDRVMKCLMNVAHCLTHLLHLESSEWEDFDDEAVQVKTMAKRFKQKTKARDGKARTGNVHDSAYCEICKHDTEVNETDKKDVDDIDFTDQLRTLVNDLKQESEPLRLTLRRLDWVRQAVKSRSQREEEKTSELSHRKSSGKVT